MSAFFKGIYFLFNPFDGENNLALASELSRIPGLDAYARWHGRSLGPNNEPWFEAMTRKRLPWEKFKEMPKGTLGRELVEWCIANNIPKETRLDHLYEIDPWPVARIYKVHDLQHMLLGFDLTPFAEIELQGVMLGTGHPDILALFNLMAVPYYCLRTSIPIGTWMYWRGFVRGWGLPDLTMFPYEAYWESPIDDVRYILGIPGGGFTSSKRSSTS